MPRPEIILTPELLRTFVTLLRCEGSVVQTALILGINEASVSKRIKPLHTAGTGARAGKLLWLRKEGKSFTPTPEGAAVLDMAIDQLRRWELFSDFVTTDRPPLVTFACGQEAVTGFVRDAVKRFHVALPEVMLRLSTQRGRDRVVGVAGGQFDLALVGQDASLIQRIARRDLHVEELFSDPLLLASSTRGVAAARFKELDEAGVTATQLADLPLILPEADSSIRQELAKNLEQANVPTLRRIVCEVGGWNAILQFVQDGLGVGLLPRSVLRRAGNKLQSRPLHPSLDMPNFVRLIARPRSSGGLELSPAGEKFAEILRGITRAMREEK